MFVQEWIPNSVKARRVLLRADLNVPVNEEGMTSDARLRAVLPTIQKLIAAQPVQIVLMSHLGRPKEGIFSEKYSLKPVAEWFASKLGFSVPLVRDYLKTDLLPPASVLLLENVRFNIGESANDPILSKQYASLADVVVMDAFATAHRAQASTSGLCQAAQQVYAGTLFCQELSALASVLETPKRPLVAIIGGAKISTKLPLLERLSSLADWVVVGGGIANTFIAAEGHAIGTSLYEPELQEKARQLLKKGNFCALLDVQVSDSLKTKSFLKKVSEIHPHESIFDLGDQTLHEILRCLSAAKTVLWNGPVGLFENPIFEKGTRLIAEALTGKHLVSILGGGDTVAAIEKFSLRAEQFTYVSTAGGAFLEFIEGKTLPVISVLQHRAQVGGNS